MRRLQVSLVIPTFRRETTLIGTLESVLAEASSDCEILVVDQTPTHTPPVDKYLSELSDDRVQVYSVSPPSLPAARNFALGRARGEIIIYIDDDVTLDSGFFQAHIGAYSDPAIGGVAGRVKGVTESPSEVLFHLDRWGRRHGSFDFEESVMTDWQRGCNMSFRRQALQAIGGFDTRFLGNAYREDCDASVRLRQAGWKIRYEAAASLVHLEDDEGGCRDEGAFAQNPHTLVNNYLFWLKHRFLLALVASLIRDICLLPYRRRGHLTYLLRLATALPRAAFRRVTQDPLRITCSYAGDS